MIHAKFYENWLIRYENSIRGGIVPPRGGMGGENEFRTTGIYSHIFKHYSNQISLKSDNFFKKTFLRKNSALYWTVRGGS